MEALAEVPKANSRHRAMIDALVWEGLTAKEVAVRFDISEARLSILRKSPLWLQEEKDALREKQGFYQARLDKLVPKAIQALEDIVEPEFKREYAKEDGTMDVIIIPNKTRDRLDAAKSILDRAGLEAGVRVIDDRSDPSGLREALGVSLDDIRRQKAELLKELGTSFIEAEIVKE